jgi:hypothetical protein
MQMCFTMDIICITPSMQMCFNMDIICINIRGLRPGDFAPKTHLLHALLLT